MGAHVTEFWRSDAMPQLEARRSCQQNSCYRRHTHDTFSLGVIESGTSLFNAGSEEVSRLHPGDVIAIPAGHVHSCNPDGEQWRYQMIHMDERWVSGLVPATANGALFSGISVLRRPGLRSRVTGWSDLLFAGAAAARIEEGLRVLLAELAVAAPHRFIRRRRNPALLDRLAPAIERLEYDATNPRLDDLARDAEMTKYQLIREMGRVTGLAPLAWRQNARVVRARHLLRAGNPIAETAHALGFADQSHFHRVFRAHVAASPGAYRG